MAFGVSSIGLFPFDFGGLMYFYMFLPNLVFLIFIALLDRWPRLFRVGSATCIDSCEGGSVSRPR